MHSMSCVYGGSLAARPSRNVASTTSSRNLFASQQRFFSGGSVPGGVRRCMGAHAPPRRYAVNVTNVLEVTQDSFEEDVLKSDKPVLVDFWAEWCGPCKLILPCVEWAEQEYGDALKVVKIDIDGSPELVNKYKIQGLPTIALFKDGELVEGSCREGAITRKSLFAYLEERGVVAVNSQ